ncbi:ATP-binding cassette domain-containing protein [Gammaproteobacteria bacterium]|nr:ATP-binding cassette domain-containing protein [Gammaproteobacteria bacterium]
MNLYSHQVISIQTQSMAGKSTLAKYIAQCTKHPSLIYHTNAVILCPQVITNAFFAHTSVFAYLKTCIHEDYINEEIAAIGLPKTILHQSPHQISIGQLKRLSILLAGSSKADLIILDETLSSLDENALEKTHQWIQQKKTMGKCFLIFTHQTLPGKYCDQRIILTKDMPTKSNQPPLPAGYLLHFENIQLPFIQTSIKSLILYQGYCSVMMGESGSGKSSLIRYLMQRHETYPYTTQCVFQQASDAFSPYLSIAQSMQLPGINQQIVNTLLREYDLCIDQLKNPSGGTMQVLQLIRALARSPEILLLDEPTSAMDQQWKSITHRILKRLMIEEKTSILLITHDKVEAHMLSKCIYHLVPQGEEHQCISPSY